MTLARSRDAGDLYNQANLLSTAVTLDLEAGRLQDAAAHLREALELNIRTASWGELDNALDCCGLLCAATSRPAEAITVWAARTAHLRHQEIPEWPQDARRRERPLRQARQALGPDRTRAAEERGAAMNMETAAEYALMLTDPGPPPAAPGPGTLSARERELVRLVARGRTDAQIADAAVHQHPHRPLPPGPDPGQDRLPPPRRPDPPGPHRRTDLAPAGRLRRARAGCGVVLPRPSGAARKG